MTEVPEKAGTRPGGAVPPATTRRNCCHAGSVSFPSSSECLGVTLKQYSPYTEGISCRAGGFWFSEAGDSGRKSLVSSTGSTTISPTALSGSAAERQSAAQYRAEATPCGSTRPAEPHPTGRQRVCGKAQSRLIDFDSKAKPAVGDADCCGALGCRVGEGLMSVTVDGRTRVLCEDCAREFLGGVV